MGFLVRADAVSRWRKAASTCERTMARRPRRGLRAGHVRNGIPRNLGDPHVSTRSPVRAAWAKGTARLFGAALRAGESERGAPGWYRGTKEDEVKRDGREGVGAPE